jgi:hypothetical protein
VNNNYEFIAIQREFEGCKGGHVLTPAQKHALAKNACNLSSLVGLAGTLRASRVDAEELKYSNHLILEAGDAFAVAINCNFSKLSSGAIELRV